MKYSFFVMSGTLASRPLEEPDVYVGGALEEAYGQHVHGASRRGADAADEAGDGQPEHNRLAEIAGSLHTAVFFEQQDSHGQHHGDDGYVREDGGEQRADHHQEQQEAHRGTLGSQARPQDDAAAQAGVLEGDGDAEHGEHEEDRRRGEQLHHLGQRQDARHGGQYGEQHGGDGDGQDLEYPYQYGGEHHGDGPLAVG